MPYKNVSPEDLFQCEKCGDCCKGYGGTFITQDDIEKIARFIGSPVETFVSTYCNISGGKPVLAQRADNYCIFWDEICTIHPVKPKMCKAWPFIESVIADPINWEIMSGACPGIRTDFPLSVVVACVKKQLSNYSQD